MLASVLVLLCLILLVAELATRGPLVEGNVTPRQVGPDALLS